MKKIFVILTFIFILIVSACGGMEYQEDVGDNVDGLSFDKYKTYIINQVEYDVYLPNASQDPMYYRFEEGKVVSNSSNWTVNFVYNVTYHVNKSKEPLEVWDELYAKLEDSEEFLEEMYGFDITIYNPYDTMELEYILENKEEVEASYVIFYTYLPLRLVNKSTYKTSTVGIPVKIDVLKKVNDMIENPFNDEMMLWEDFLAIEN